MLRSEDHARARITALYRSLLDREPDPAGLEAWTGSFRSGLALQDIIAGFCDGYEYKASHPVGPAFVESLYLRLLRRPPDPDGTAAWLAALDQRSSTLSVIRGFLCSAEYCTQRALEIHEQLLGRSPAQAELSEHGIALMQGMALQQIVLGVVTSAEYIARAATRRAESSPAPAPVPPAPAPVPARGSAPHVAQAATRSPDPDDEDVLGLVRGGDVRGALQCAMQRHGAAVYRFCRMATGDAALAEDIQQQVFVDAFRDLPRFAGRSAVRTWLLGIARHRVLDAARRRQRARSHLEHTAIPDPPDPRPSPGEWLDEARLQAVLVACVDELEEPARTAVLLRYQQGLTYEEMAVICGEHSGTLQARVARAVRRLRELVGARMDR